MESGDLSSCIQVDSSWTELPIQAGVDYIYTLASPVKVIFPPDNKTMSAPDFMTRSRLVDYLKV